MKAKIGGVDGPSSGDTHGTNKSNTRVLHVNDSIRNVQYDYRSNYIRTTKYTKWSFFPLSLINQFRRAANVYFLIVATL